MSAAAQNQRCDGKVQAANEMIESGDTRGNEALREDDASNHPEGESVVKAAKAAAVETVWHCRGLAR